MNSQLAEVTSTANDRPVKKPFASESRVLTAENRALALSNFTESRQGKQIP